MKQWLSLVTFLLFSFLLAVPLSAEDDSAVPIHGNYYGDVGVGWVYWDYKNQRALVLPFSQTQLWGSKSFFGTSMWRLAWGGPDDINLSWGTSIHYFPFDQILDLSAGAFLGTFLFLDGTLLLQPKVSIDIPVGKYSFLGLGVGYDWQLVVLTTQIEKGIGHIEGIEGQLVWSTKIY